MFDEIEKFLRQAAEAAQQEQAKRAAEQRRRTGQQQRPAQRPPPRQLVPEADVVEAELAEEGPSRLSRDFRSTTDIAEHTRHLGERVGQADEQLDKHLHQTFDHKVGTLKSRGESATDKAATVSVTASSDVVRSILQLLASRDSIRSAMVLGEILRRPEERWR